MTAVATIDPNARPQPAQARQDNAAARAKDTPKEAEFTFDDLIDVINPLQHLPIVSTIYRAITGDEITPHARAMGGGLYGGPVGLLSAGVSMAVEEAVGDSPDKILASLFSSDAPEEAELAAKPASTPAPVAETAAAPQPKAAEDKPAAPTAPEPAATPIAAPASRRGMRFFPLPGGRTQTIPLAQARAAAPPPPAAEPAQAAAAGQQQLSAAQNALLEKFVAGAQASSPTADLAPGLAPRSGAPGLPNTATAEWFAAQMQANLQKYAAAQAAAERDRAADAAERP